MVSRDMIFEEAEHWDWGSNETSAGNREEAITISLVKKSIFKRRRRS